MLFGLLSARAVIRGALRGPGRAAAEPAKPAGLSDRALRGVDRHLAAARRHAAMIPSVDPLDAAAARLAVQSGDLRHPADIPEAEWDRLRLLAATAIIAASP
jgi:hypothetical protein